jgi:hypothetical protein
LELLIIDDASDDNTAGVVTEFHDPRIIYRYVTRIGSPAGQQECETLVLKRRTVSRSPFSTRTIYILQIRSNG